jgi:hypothetical protein
MRKIVVEIILKDSEKRNIGGIFEYLKKCFFTDWRVINVKEVKEEIS